MRLAGYVGRSVRGLVAAALIGGCGGGGKQSTGAGGAGQGGSAGDGGTGAGSAGTVGGQLDARGTAGTSSVTDGEVTDRRDATADATTGDAASEAPSAAKPRAMRWELEPSSPHGIGVLGGTGPTDVWFVDIGGKAHRTTGDGQWTVKTVTASRLTGIWAFAPNNVYLPGQINAVYHWDGATWDPEVTATGAGFSSIWASGIHDLYAVGTGLYRSSGDRMWTFEALPMAEGALVGVWGSGPGDVWILDSMHNAHHGKGGGPWERQRTGLGLTPSIAIWGSGPNDIYALAGAALAHSTGDGQWSLQSVPRTDANETLECIWGTGPNDIYIGAGGGMYRSVGDGRWYREPLPPMPPLVFSVDSVWGPNADDIYAAAEIGIFRGRPAN